MTSMAAEEAPERIAGTSQLEEQVSDTSTGKVVVNRSMSLDGFIAGPGHTMDWGAGRPLADFVAPDDLQEIAAATGAMLIGRRTHEVGKRMEPDEPGSVDYPFSGPFFVLTHEPPDPPDPGITFLSGDIGEAVATALDAAGGKNLEILGADVAGQCLRRGLVDESRRDLGVCDAGAARRRHPPPPRASPGWTWNRSVARGRETSPASGSTSASSTGAASPTR